MKDWKEQGGGAFPIEGGEFSGLYADPGMSLRDYFAAKALHGICSHPDTWGLQDEGIAARAYCLADLMIAERDK